MPGVSTIAAQLAHADMFMTAADDGELELAVFRFTLGIPGFDDTYIPRVVGGLGLLLLLGNHLLGPGASAGAQVHLMAIVDNTKLAARVLDIIHLACNTCRHGQKFWQLSLLHYASPVPQLNLD